MKAIIYNTIIRLNILVKHGSSDIGLTFTNSERSPPLKIEVRRSLFPVISVNFKWSYEFPRDISEPH